MSESKIFTVTFNPSLDRTLVVHHLAVGYHNRTEESTRLDSAGQGVNIAHGLHLLNRDAHAIILLGDDATGRAYQALISEEDFESTFIRVNGHTRSNTIIYDTGKHAETQISEESVGISQSDIDNVAGALRGCLKYGDFVVYSGARRGGAPVDTYAQLTGVAHDLSAQVVLITGGSELEAALKVSPDLVVLRQIEAEAFFNYPVRNPDDVVSAAHNLRDRGAQKVLVTMHDSSTAVLVAEEGGWLVEIPDVEGTTSGMWDAFLAGYLAGRAGQKPLAKSLALGAAAATFTASQVGHEFGGPADIREFAEGIEVKPVARPEMDS